MDLCFHVKESTKMVKLSQEDRKRLGVLAKQKNGTTIKYKYSSLLCRGYGINNMVR